MLVGQPPGLAGLFDVGAGPEDSAHSAVPCVMAGVPPGLVGVPPGLEEFFSLPGVSATFLLEIAKEMFVGPQTCLVPCLRVLPMGRSWSL